MTKPTTIDAAIASAAKATNTPRRQLRKRPQETYRTQRNEENRYKVQNVNRSSTVARFGKPLALWERALTAHARLSPEFQKFCGTVALLLVVSVAWLFLDAHRQEVLREQHNEQQRQADERTGAQRAEAREAAQHAEARDAAQRKAAQQAEAQLVPDMRSPSRVTPSADRGPVGSADVMTSALTPSPLGGSFAPGDLGLTIDTGAAVPCAPSCALAGQSSSRPNPPSRIVRHKESQRQAAIAAHQAAAGREIAAERAAVISASDLSFSNVTLRPRLAANNGQPHTQVQMDGLQILSGTITNHSKQTLRNLEVELTLKDCPAGHDSDECKVVINPTVDISPNQTRAFSDILGFGRLPHLDPQGQPAFSWRIVTASSCSQENLSAHRCAGKTAAR